MMGNKVDRLRFKLREKNSLIVAKKKKLSSLERDRQGLAPGLKRRQLNSSIHKLRNSLKKMARNADSLTKLIRAQQIKLVKGQQRSAPSQYKREEKRKESITSQYEEVRNKIRYIKPEIDRLEGLAKSLASNVDKLKKEEELIKITKTVSPYQKKLEKKLKESFYTDEEFFGSTKVVPLEGQTKLETGVRQVTDVSSVSTVQVVKPVDTKERAVKSKKAHLLEKMRERIPGLAEMQPELRKVVPERVQPVVVPVASQRSLECSKHPFSKGGSHMFIDGKCTFCGIDY
jgi:chromosome segregation ATPase